MVSRDSLTFADDDKQKQRLKEAWLLKKESGLDQGAEAVSGGNLSTAGVSALASGLATDDATSLNKDPKSVLKTMRKKALDPESIKLREQKLKENRLQRESDNYYNA